MQTPERVRCVLFDNNGPMSPETKKTIIKNAENSGKVKDYTNNAVFCDKNGNILNDIASTQNMVAQVIVTSSITCTSDDHNSGNISNINAITVTTPLTSYDTVTNSQDHNDDIINKNTSVSSTAIPISPTHAVTNTPGKHVLTNKQKVVIKKHNAIRMLTLFTEEKPAKKIPDRIIITKNDIRLAEKLSKGEKENLPFGPLNIGKVPSNPIKKRKNNISQNDVMYGLSAAKLMAITELEERLEEGLAERAGLIKKKLNEYTDQELEKICVTADFRTDGQWLHSVAYSLGDGTPNGNTQVRNNLSAGDASVNDRMKTAEEVARELRKRGNLAELQFSAVASLKKVKTSDSDNKNLFRQEGASYSQTLSYLNSSVTFFHDTKNKNKRTRAHKAYLEPLVNAYLQPK